MPEVIIPAPHPATHPARKVRIVGPLVDFHAEGQRIRVTPRYAGADRDDPWVYVLGRVRPHVELIAAGMAATAPRETPAGIEKPCAVIPCPPQETPEGYREAMRSAWFRTFREPIRYR